MFQLVCIDYVCYTRNGWFEWNATKATLNERRHRVSFEEARSCFRDPNQLAFYDPDHSNEEDREILVAHSSRGRLLVVVYTLRGETIRIISARRGTRKETSDYARGI